MIRAATAADGPEIARIYNQAMKPGVYATAAVEPVTADNRAQMIASFQPPHGVWVMEGPDGLLGWCSLGPFPVRPALVDTAEVSVYVDEAARGRRVGAALLGFLVIHARKAGLRGLVSIVFERNVPSVAGSVLAGFRITAGIGPAATIRGDVEPVSWLHKNLADPDPEILTELLQVVEGMLQ